MNGEDTGFRDSVLLLVGGARGVDGMAPLGEGNGTLDFKSVGLWLALYRGGI